MGLFYTAQFNAVAVTAAQDLFEITAPADAVVILHWIRLTQSTEIADAQEEELSILFKRGATTTGTGGTQAIAAVPIEFGFPAQGSVIDVNNTTKATSGTITTLHADTWNVRGPFEWLPTPECRFVLSPSQRFTVELVAAPTDSITMNGVMYFEEIGG
jgi:hypothetical protein